MASVRTSTQSFTGIKDIKDDIVLFDKGYACMVIELNAVNFALLSPAEQDAKIVAFAGLLNSLSFPLQIVIRSKKLDISNYLRLLEQQSQKTADEALSLQIRRYRDFVAELVRVNIILDKKFYVVISFSFLEKVRDLGNFEETAKSSLHSKSSSLSAQLARLNLRAKILQRDELVKLFYDLYNERL